MKAFESPGGAVVLDVPPLKDMIPLTEAAKQLGVGLQSVHRWRMHDVTPLMCWKVGREWRTTLDAIEDFIRRRTLAAMRGEDAETPTPPMYTAKRRRQIDAAIKECERLGC